MNKLIAIVVVLAIGAFVGLNSLYTVSEVEQVIITQFGKPVGDPVTTAGLKVKVPFIQSPNILVVPSARTRDRPKTGGRDRRRGLTCELTDEHDHVLHVAVRRI